MSLDTVLQEAVTAAIHFGKYRIWLKGGLLVEMYVENDCILCLTLSRAHQLPSITEWLTVAKYWPWVITAKPQTSGNCLTAALTIHPKYIQQVLPVPLD